MPRTVPCPELETTVATFGTDSLRATEQSTRGGLMVADGDLAATVILGQAVVSWHGLGVPYEEATARTLLGEALRAAGDEIAAAAVL